MIVIGYLEPIIYMYLPKIPVVSSRWMIHSKEWVFNIFIQRQYPVLTYTYKKDTVSYKLQTINKTA